MAISTMVSTAKKFVQFGFFVFVKARETNLRGNLQDTKYDGDRIFLWELFLFYEKVPSLLESVSFFRNIFTPTPGDVFNLSSLVNSMQLY